MDSILQYQNLTKHYGSTCGLNDLTLDIPRGRIIGLLGPNCSGKTTFIKLCTGLLVPTSGTLTIGGHPIGTETKKIVSYLPEHTYINNWMRVKEMLEFFSNFYKDFNIDKARDMLLTFATVFFLFVTINPDILAGVQFPFSTITRMICLTSRHILLLLSTEHLCMMPQRYLSSMLLCPSVISPVNIVSSVLSLLFSGFSFSGRYFHLCLVQTTMSPHYSSVAFFSSSQIIF